jgi:hypothetical protein
VCKPSGIAFTLPAIAVLLRKLEKPASDPVNPLTGSVL